MQGCQKTSRVSQSIGVRARALRRVACTGIAVLVMYADACAAAAAPAYPAKPIRIVVGTAAGGGIDTVARKVGGKLSESLGQPVIVDNRPGGAQRIATDAVAKAAPDGYTLMCISSTHAIIPSLFKDLPFDPVRDFAPVTLVCATPTIIVTHDSIEARSIKDLITLLKANPGKFSYSSAGTGTR